MYAWSSAEKTNTYGLHIVNIDGVALLSVKYSTFVLAWPFILGLSNLLGLKPEIMMLYNSYLKYLDRSV